MDTIIKQNEYDYNSLIKLLKELEKKFPFIKRTVIGKSVLGRDIPLIALGSSPSPMLFAAAFHGNERITSLIMLRFLEEVCDAIKGNKTIDGVNVRGGLRERSFLIAPIVNPDGCEISLKGSSAAGVFERTVSRISGGDYDNFKANARGVDINHNFNADWENLHEREKSEGILGPSASRFGGANSESEPETAALCSLCRKIDIRHAVALHTQGEEIYWNYGTKTPKKSQRMAQIMSEVSGYKMSKPEGLAVGGGFKDWFIDELHKPGFTIEMGLGRNPLPVSELQNIYLKAREMLLLSAIM